jgi:RNA polymerase sigma factor (sigma-70 family)
MRLKSNNSGVLKLDAQLSPQNREFYQNVFKNHHLSLCRFLRQLRVADDQASDLIQDVYLRIVRQNEPHKLAQSPRGYLYRTAINLLRDRLRRDKLHARALDEISIDAESLSLVATPERILQQTQNLDALRHAIRQLDPGQRRVLLLHRFNNMTCRDIAKELDLPQRTVERRLSQSLAFCRSRVWRQ